MQARPRIVKLLWDDWNLDHMIKHGVLPEEAEEVVTSNSFYRATYKDRLQVVGPATSGRILSIIIGEVPLQPGHYYVFSARPASRKERNSYAQYTRGV